MIPKDRLLAMVGEKISDRRILELIGMYLQQEIMEELKTWTPASGVPQGAVLSPLLSNIYLNPLDHLMEDSGFEMVRYADDFVVMCRSAAEAEAALAVVRTWITSVGLTLHPEKTQIVDSREKSFAFLGYSFRGKLRFPRGKSVEKVRDRIRLLPASQATLLNASSHASTRAFADGLRTSVTVTGVSLTKWIEWFVVDCGVCC